MARWKGGAVKPREAGEPLNANWPVYKLSKWFIWSTSMVQSRWVVTDWDPRKEWRGDQLRYHKRYDNRADAELAAMEMCEQ